MSRSPDLAGVDPSSDGFLGGGVLLVGVGFALYGASVYRWARTSCEACAPFHPLFVLAPVVFGLVLATVGGAVLAARS